MVVPPENGAVDLSIERHRDFLIALPDGGRLEFGNSVLEIGAAIAPKIGGLRGRVRVRAYQQSRASSDEQA